MTITRLATLIAAITFTGSINAADQTDYQFTAGNVLVRCMAPDEHPLITTELFNAAFPEWITSMQKMANNGLISRAHYLGELKEGIFIVVEGETRNQAMVNATAVISEINAVTAKAIEETGESPDFAIDDACQFIEIGPVAIIPAK